MIVHNEEVITRGARLENAEKALIMLHEKGGTAQNFIKVAENLSVDPKQYTILAIQAVQNFWYPHDTLQPLEKNQPQLRNSLDGIAEVIHNLAEFDIDPKDIYFLGLGQGASLALEYCARNATKYGGIVAFSGGLVGEHLAVDRYRGDFDGTNVLIAAVDNDSNPDRSRVNETENILKNMGAKVTQKMFPESGRTLIEDEIAMADLIIS